MQLNRVLPVLLVWMAICGNPAAAQPVDFAHDIVPVLKKHCTGCHGGREAKGSFSMNTREVLMDSGHVESGKPEESWLLQLIVSDDPELQMPPRDKPRVTPAERELLRRWIAEGVTWDDGFSFAPTAWEPPLKPRRPQIPDAVGNRTHPIDRILDAWQLQQGLELTSPVDDAVFLRRVSLDLIGLLPAPEQLHRFMQDSAPDKRERVIDELLDNRIAWADHWLTFFNDLFRNDYSGTGFITGGRTQISGWLYESLLNNKPYDVMARELIAPSSPASRGFIDGIRWRGEVSAGQTVEIQFAQSVSQSFLGINLKCASCHDSFIDRWRLDEAYGLAAVYSERPLEIHRCDKPVGRQAQAAWLFPEIGQIDAQASRDERLQQLAALMTHPDNGRFTRTIVNRLWYRLMGRGIVHPLDAMQSRPWNSDLLDFLAVSLADSNYDLKSVVRLIATSESYQSRSAVRTVDPQGDYVYEGPIPRRMTAEQFLDSVWQITGAAPATIDAPVFRAVADQQETSALRLNAHWIWGASAADGRIPPAGEVVTLRKTFSLPGQVDRGGAVITCDNQFLLYVNGREVSRGDNWTEPQAVALHTVLKKGENQIVVVATNAGSEPNPAGLYFEARLHLADGSTQAVASDASWEFNPQQPNGREGRMGTIPGTWTVATVVTPVDAWTRTISSNARNILAQAISGNIPMVRASLLKNDFLMKSLGRPLREQIVSMRPSDLTTLEAINLSNGQSFADTLSQGAKQLAAQDWNAPSQLVDYLYQFAFSRSASAAEREVVDAYLSRPPRADEIEDLLWTIFMSPEFMLIR